MPWPPYSPDLNPIENLWSIMKREIYKIRPEREFAYDTVATLNLLIETAKEAWNSIDEELAQVLEHCNRISALVDPALRLFEAAHPAQGSALRQVLGHGIARAIQGPQTRSKTSAPKKYAFVTSTQKQASEKLPETIPAAGQMDKKQVLRASRPLRQGTADRRVMIRLAANHPSPRPRPPPGHPRKSPAPHSSPFLDH
ncbi:hypothetical protein ACJ73_00324 [Blastomyces percursus]|uniref:Tc1-like transposase DDE domain-containing protein n=1 Tax=Blastomyces percursus TaxID=1658174 RepID=A0A1J9QIF6_9EURO|nr:hypothetical protein ACJ73_00324 [Blastomyces percursus]